MQSTGGSPDLSNPKSADFLCSATIFILAIPAESVTLQKYRDLGSVPAEKKVLWRIEGQAERALVEPFKANYKELVAAARERVKGGDEES